MSEDTPQAFGESPQCLGPPPGEPTPVPHTAPPSASAGVATPASPAQGPAAAPPGDWLARLLHPVQESRNWLKFMGFVSIVIGGFLALTIVGLLFAWLYIWVGVLLWQAGDRAGWAHAQSNAFMLEQYLGKLRTVIAILGVVTAIHVVMTVLAIGFFFTLGGVAALMNAIRY